MTRTTANTTVDEQTYGSAIDESSLGQTGDCQLLRELLEASPVGSIAVDDAGSIVFANAAASDVLGYRPSEFVGEALATFTVDEQHHTPTIY